MTKLGSGTSTSATQILEILILFFFQWGHIIYAPYTMAIGVTPAVAFV